MKVYYSFENEKGKWITKDTLWHVDVTTDEKGVPRKNNSQLPGTPMAILTFGDDKNLWFRKHKSKDEFKENSTVVFRQRNGSCIIMDGDDEYPGDDGLHWRHMSNMVDRREGITFAFMCRVVQKEVLVDSTNNTLVEQRISEKKLAQLKAAEHHFDTDYYQYSVKRLNSGIKGIFQKTQY